MSSSHAIVVHSCSYYYYIVAAHLQHRDCIVSRHVLPLTRFAIWETALRITTLSVSSSVSPLLFLQVVVSHLFSGPLPSL